MAHEETDIRAVAEALAEVLYADDPVTYAAVRAGFGDEGGPGTFNTVQIGGSKLLAGGSWNAGPADPDHPEDGPKPALDGNSPISVLVRAIALVLQAHVETVTTPGSSDDETKGYRPGKWWIVTSGPTLYLLIDATEGAANWFNVTSGGGGGSGTTLQVDGAALAATTGNLNATTPAALVDGVNVRWQKNAASPTAISANVPVDGATIVPSSGALAVGAIPESKVTNLVSDLAALVSSISSEASTRSAADAALAALISAISIGSLGGVPTSRTLTGSGAAKVEGDNAAHDLSANRTISVSSDGTTIVQTGNTLAVGAIAESQVTNLTTDLAAKALKTTALTGSDAITVDGDNAAHDLSASRTIAARDSSSTQKGVLKLTGDLRGSAGTPKLKLGKVVALDRRLQWG